MFEKRTGIIKVAVILLFASFIMLFISGCKPEVEVVPVESVSISAANNATTINTIGGTLQFTAVVLPADAEDKAVIWSVINGTGEGTISQNGLLTAVADGTVTVKATAHADSSKTAQKIITISNQEVVPNSISVSSEDDLAFIDEYQGTLQMIALVLPANALDKTVVWSVQNGTGEATISAGGLLTAVKNGTVTVKATSSSNAAVFGTKNITISNQEVLVTSVVLSTVGNVQVIDEFGGTLQINVAVLPANALDKTVVWSVQNVTGSATISTSGLLTAVSNGTVTVKATSNSDNTVFGTKIITISNQEVEVTSIELTSADDVQIIDQFGGTLQFNANILPSNADDKAIGWSVIDVTGSATISNNGLLTAVSNGTVTVRVTSLSNPSVYEEMTITISNQEVVVSSVVVSGFENANIIDEFEGTLQMSALVLPEGALDKSVTWSVQNGTGSATISASGLVTAVSNGTVEVKATSNSNPGVYGTKLITISNQEVEVTSIELTSAGGVVIINQIGGTLQFNANVLPSNADDKSIVWSVESGTGSATINASGLLTAVANGTVSVKVTSLSDSSIFAEMLITITNQEVLVSSISVSGYNASSVINVFQGSLQMSALVLPENAFDKTVIWSVESGTGSATISESGLLQAVSNGTVTVKATATNNANVYGTKVITISNQEIMPESITVSGFEDAVAIDVFEGTLQMSALVLPIDAFDKTVIWSVENETGEATISASGLLQAVSNGTVTVVATSSVDGAIVGTILITISNQEIMPESITVSGFEDAVVIDEFEGTLQMSALVLPIDAFDKTVIWSVENETGSATISASGLLQAVSNGTVTVIATSSVDGAIVGTILITISNQEIMPESITVSGFEDAVAIDVFEGTLQMSALVLPVDAFDKTVIWSVQNGTGEATISASGLLQAVSNGTVEVKATSSVDELVFGTILITISNQEIMPESITVSGFEDAVVIDVFEGTLQMSALVLPENAFDKTVIWSVQNGTGEATIDAFGLLQAVSNGTVEVIATSSVDELVFGTILITISNQEVLPESITVSGFEDAIVIDVFEGTLQMSALVLPENAFDKTVTWSVQNGTGEATIDAFGLLQAVSNGTVEVKATSSVDEFVFGTILITISNQEIMPESITVSGFEDAVVIDVIGGTLQMSALVLPENAFDKTVIWDVESIDGSAIISADGLLTAVDNGTVTVKATSSVDFLVYGTLVITITNQDYIAPEGVELLTAGNFTILTKTGITTTSNSMIIGDIGTSPAPATYITGFALSLDSSTTFATSPQVVGNIYASDYSAPTPAYLTQAISDMEAAYTDAAGRAANFTELFSGDLSGQTLPGGVYKYGTDVVIYSNLTLSGSAEDVWIFQISGNLTQAVSVNIILAGGALAENVYWQVAGGVAIETSAHFVGTILAMTEISLGTSASVNGRLLSQTAVTLDQNLVSLEEIINVESITVSSFEDAVVIDVFEGTLQMFADVLPIDATNKAVIWSVENGTGEAVISEDGILTAVSNGTVIVKAASSVNDLIFDTMEITLSNQEIYPTSITVSGFEDAIVIDEFEGTLQMSALVLPEDAFDKSIVWSVINGTGEATIDEFGVLHAVSNGTVTVRATSLVDELMFGEKLITISNQEIMPESITVSGFEDAVAIDEFEGTLQMSALVLPIDAFDKTVIWSVQNGTGEATISASGLLQAVSNGTVEVKATSSVDELVFGTILITISNQEVLPESITVSGFEDAIVINVFEGTLQMSALVLPENAFDKTVIWSVENETGEATISESGLLSAVSNGTVLVKATSNVDPLVFGTIQITISNQEVLPNSITVSGFEDAVVIDVFEGTLQMSALVLPEDAYDKTVIWSVVNGSGQATIDAFGLLQAVSNGTVTVVATSTVDALVFGEKLITISNQEIMPESITVSGFEDAEIIDVYQGTLQMSALVLPEDAFDKTVIWSVQNGTGEATISPEGLLTAVANGTVTVKAISSVDELVFGIKVITISNQEMIPFDGVDLLTAADYKILAKTGISTTAGTLITGDIGVSPIVASAITGFGLAMDPTNEFATSSMVTGKVYASDYTSPTPEALTQAVLDMEAAYTTAAGMAPDFNNLHAGDISGQTLTPGVYNWTTGLLINDHITISGNATDIWIFQIAGTLTQAANINIILSGGADVNHIIWQVSSAVTIGVGAHFEGTILGGTAVNLGTDASLNGRIYAQTAVTLDSNIIN